MNLERIASLLSQNLKPSQVASIVGCSPARITQISQTEEFKLLLADKTQEQDKKNDESILLDAQYLAAEHMLLKGITEMAPTAELRDQVQALRVITERQYRKQQITNPVTNGNVSLTQNVIQVSIPVHALPEISLNSQNEVTAINQHTLAPLSSQGVTSLFKNMKEGKYHEPERILTAAEADVVTVAQEPEQKQLELL